MLAYFVVIYYDKFEERVKKGEKGNSLIYLPTSREWCILEENVSYKNESLISFTQKWND